MTHCGCAVCENRISFALPDDLLNQFTSGKCVLFVGAGVSTENKTNTKTTLYEEVSCELGAEGDMDFPSLMSLYCERPDGRIKLIRKIRDRIEYFRSFRGFYIPMTSFHRALRPLFMIEDVITTNWDDFIEIESGYDPFVYDEDIALLDSSKRRLIKIHGSISNNGSIVATKSDYDSALKRLNKGPLGAYLKMLLSTKTLVYVGYSLRDPNYLKILKSMSYIMGKFSRSAYFVSPYIDYYYLKKTGLKIIPIQTDGTYFLEQLRLHHNSNSCSCSRIVDEDNFDRCEQLLIDVNDLHSATADEFLATGQKLFILALSYQDGLQDALMRIKDTRRRGEYYQESRLVSLIHGYEVKIKEYMEKGNYWDACYCRGYSNGILFLLTKEDGVYPPAVDLCFDETPNTIAKLRRYSRKRTPIAAWQDAERICCSLAPGMIPEHLPYV